MISDPNEGTSAEATQSQTADGANPDMNDCCAPLQQQLDAAEAELAKLREDVLRERADLENQRRRVVRDIENARRFANERVLGDLLPVMDSLEAGLAQAGDAAGPLREGMELTLRQLLKVGGDHGLTAIDPAGEPFDPDRHQAISTVPATPDQPKNHVVQVFQKGWLLNERLLRPALVVVSQGG